MKETFETNVSDSQKEELANQKAYEDSKAAKEEESAAGQAQILHFVCSTDVIPSRGLGTCPKCLFRATHVLPLRCLGTFPR